MKKHSITVDVDFDDILNQILDVDPERCLDIIADSLDASILTEYVLRDKTLDTDRVLEFIDFDYLAQYVLKHDTIDCDKLAEHIQDTYSDVEVLNLLTSIAENSDLHTREIIKKCVQDLKKLNT
jgi:hypothetical protein